MKVTYERQFDALTVAGHMVDLSMSPVWTYEVPGGWQLTGRGDLTTSKPVMPPLMMLAELSKTTPKFHRGHTKRKVYRVAWCDGGFTQMHQPVSTSAVARVLRTGSAVVVVGPRGEHLYRYDIIGLLRPYMKNVFLAINKTTWRHWILIPNKVRESALADAHDTVVLHHILGAQGQLFEGVKPYGYHAGGEGKSGCR